MSITLITPAAPAVTPAADVQEAALGLFGAQKGYKVNLGGASAIASASTDDGAWIKLPFAQNIIVVKAVVSALVGTLPTYDFALKTCNAVTGGTNGVGGTQVDSPQFIVPFLDEAAVAAPRLSAPGTVYLWAVVGQYVAFRGVGGGTITSGAFAVTAVAAPVGFQFE